MPFKMFFKKRKIRSINKRGFIPNRCFFWLKGQMHCQKRQCILAKSIFCPSVAAPHFLYRGAAARPISKNRMIAFWGKRPAFQLKPASREYRRMTAGCNNGHYQVPSILRLTGDRGFIRLSNNVKAIQPSDFSSFIFYYGTKKVNRHDISQKLPVSCFSVLPFSSCGVSLTMIPVTRHLKSAVSAIPKDLWKRGGLLGAWMASFLFWTMGFGAFIRACCSRAGGAENTVSARGAEENVSQFFLMPVCFF